VPLDPQAQFVLDAMAGAGMELTPDQTPAEMRAGMEQSRMAVEPEPVAAVLDRVIPGPDGNDVAVRIYHPVEDPRDLPVVVFFHGGGWVIGGIDSHDGTVRQMVNRSGMIWVSVEYRLSPEHPFPAGHEDAYAATVWAAAHAPTFGGDPTRLAVAGDSAGGNLAAAVALMARDRGGPALRLQLLVYPCCDLDPDRWPSMTENGEGYFLTRRIMDWFYDHTFAPEDRRDPYAAPVHATDLSGVAPALVITAEFDPLRDEGEHYGAMLQAAGVDCAVSRYEGVFHGFFGMAAAMDKATEAQAQAAAVLRAAMAEG
jgi:acetyl esterase